jgi:ABC-type transport system involved in multi-copper enzyme maturation permease subunit
MDPRRLSRCLAVAANTFRETVRERVLYNLLLFALVMIFSGLFLGQLSVRQDEKIIKDIGLASIELFGTLIALFVGVGLVSKEIERRSLYPLIAKPVTRGEFLLGKFAGLAFTLAVNTTVMTFGLLATLWATGRGLNLGLLRAIYPIFLGLLVVVALALLFSTLTSSALASICTVCTVVLGRYSDVIKNMKQVVPDAPGWLVSSLYYALPNFRNFDFKDRVVYGEPIDRAVFVAVTAYALLYVGMVLLAALSSFRAKEFT